MLAAPFFKPPLRPFDEVAMKTVWRLITHHKNPEAMLSWSVSHRRLAIGWGESGNLTKVSHTTPDQISTVLEQHDMATATVGGHCLFNFAYRMKVGDLVILSTGESGGRRLVMQVMGGYEWQQSPEPPLNN